MRGLAFFLTVFCLLLSIVQLRAQKLGTYTITADTVKLTSCDSTELVLRNHTDTVPGFLFNTGGGQTVFKRAVQPLGNNAYLFGADTLQVGSPNAWLQGGNRFGTTGVLGTLDSNHLDFYTNNIQRGRWTNTGDLLIGSTTDNGYKLDVNGPLRLLNFFTIQSNVSGNTGPFIISANSSAVGNAADFTLSVNTGARIFFSDYASIFSSSISCTSFHTGPAILGTLLQAGTVDLDGAVDNADNSIFLSAGQNHRKAALIEKALGTYGRMDLQFAFNNIGDTSIVKASDTKVTFKANGNVLIGSTTDNGNTFQVTGTGSFTSNLGIGTASPTAQLHTTGSVRFAGLTQDSTQTDVLVSDANGNLYYRSASSLALDNPIRSTLAVNGTIKSRKIIISPDDWADYVFDSSYRLPHLDEVETYIHREHHLPGIPSAAAIHKDSLDVGAGQVALLKKIEELTLYTIDQNKRLDEQQKEIEQLKAKLETITDKQGLNKHE